MYQGQGAVNFVVKSGETSSTARSTNTSATPYSTLADSPKTRPPEHQNEYGFNLGGPIIRNSFSSSAL